MSYLLIGDPHLSDRPRDDYRFALFDQVRVWQDIHKPQATFLLGDLTHEKDRHSAALVNKTVEGILKLKPPVFILKGNHDYIDPENPFFKFTWVSISIASVSMYSVDAERLAVVSYVEVL